jgi:outer membrane protein W
MSVLGGMGDYPGVKNVRGNYALGFSIGQKINDRALVEGQFMYSNYHVEDISSTMWAGYGYNYYPRITNMEQYSGTMAMKYQILGGLFRPFAGGAAAYTYRTFNDIQMGNPSVDSSSHALDIGLTAGADVEMTESFSLGLDVRYMWNIVSRSQSSGLQPSFSQVINNGGTPVEKLSYMNIALTGRMMF